MMSTRQESRTPLPNRLLARLPGDVLEALRPSLEQVTLAHGQTIIEPLEQIPYIYFPTGALLSLVTIMEDGSTVESGCIGLEGMAGLPVLLETGVTPMQTLAQIPGHALRIKSEILKEAFDRGGALQSLLYRYMHAVIVTGSQSTACNRLHRVEERLCRWLLMSSDGIASEEIALTHEFLATMLGIRRAGVSEAAARLQDEGLISYIRASIRIVDRKRLEATACECYRLVKEEYERVLG